VLIAVLCALGSALFYALASVLQHRGASSQPDEQSMRMGLLLRLARSTTWLTGLVFDGGGYVLQFIALGHGAIAVVQPLLVCGLLFALPIGARWAGRRLSRADWIGSVLVCAGLATFLAVADPAAGVSNTRPFQWTVLLLALSIGAGICVVGGRNGGPRRRAVLLALGAGVLYGGAAALTKTSSHLLSHGLFAVVTHWQPYLLILFGAVGMLMGQSAFQAGTLDLSLPTMTASDPIVSVVIGASVFKESIASDPLAVVVEVASMLALTSGVYLLARYEAAEQPPGLPGEDPADRRERREPGPAAAETEIG
jgi:drug/metabolite transporter (DMT)-like permease